MAWKLGVMADWTFNSIQTVDDIELNTKQCKKFNNVPELN